MASPPENLASAAVGAASAASTLPTWFLSLTAFLITVIFVLGAYVIQLIRKQDSDKEKLIQEEIDEVRQGLRECRRAVIERDSDINVKLQESAERNLGVMNDAAHKMSAMCEESKGKLAHLFSRVEELTKGLAIVEHRQDEQQKDMDEMGGHFRHQSDQTQKTLEEIKIAIAQLATRMDNTNQVKNDH